MRNIFFEQLKIQMRKDKNIFVVVADMGMGLVEQFKEEFPDRFINVGIAEQNMAGISAGLCNAGFRPFCYTISNFLVERCFEQLRNDICYHNYPVTFVGTSTGFDNGGLGPTHHVIDDVGCVKILPNLRIYSPSTVSGMKMAFQDILSEQKPAYLRIGKGSFDLSIESKDINHMVIERKQKDILIITHGNIIEAIVKAVGEEPIASVYCMTKIKPINDNELNSLFKRYHTVVVIEDHFITSGLYNTLCQNLVQSGHLKTRLLAIAPPESYEERIGDKNYFAEKYGLTPEYIKKFILNLQAA